MGVQGKTAGEKSRGIEGSAATHVVRGGCRSGSRRTRRRLRRRPCRRRRTWRMARARGRTLRAWTARASPRATRAPPRGGRRGCRSRRRERRPSPGRWGPGTGCARTSPRTGYRPYFKSTPRAWATPTSPRMTTRRGSARGGGARRKSPSTPSDGRARRARADVQWCALRGPRPKPTTRTDHTRNGEAT